MILLLRAICSLLLPVYPRSRARNVGTLIEGFKQRGVVESPDEAQHWSPLLYNNKIMALETVRVKEEGQSECDARAGEWECGVSVECVRVKEEGESEEHESGVSAAAARAGLYAGHEVKGELVLGPERLQPPDSALTIGATSENTDLIASHSSTNKELCIQCPVEGPQSRASSRDNFWTLACSVKLERLLINKNKPVKNTIRKSCLQKQTNHEKKTYTPEPGAAGKLYSCDNCGAQFEWKQSIILHLKRHNAATPKRKVAPEKDLIVKQICPETHSQAITRDQLQTRTCSVKLDRLPGSKEPASSTIHRTCKKQTYDKKINGRPERDPNELYSCNNCGKQFALKKSIVQHLQLHCATAKKSKSGDNTVGRKFKCEICMKQFKLKSSLKLHNQVHTEEKPYECKICMKKLKYKSGLRIHNRIHTEEKYYECKICMKSFLRNYSLVLHNAMHTGEKPYKCEICMKRFLRRSQLVRHKRVHTGEKPYKCDICMKCFAYQNNFADHKKIHAGELPYKCEICMKQFVRSSRLVEHKEIHTGETPFKCEICMQQFLRKKYLVQHLIIHTGKKQYKCDICMKQFYRPGHLAVHKRQEIIRMQKRSKSKKTTKTNRNI